MVCSEKGSKTINVVLFQCPVLEKMIDCCFVLFAGRDVTSDYKPRQPFYATAAALSPMGFSQTRQSMTPPPGQSQNLPIGG